MERDKWSTASHEEKVGSYPYSLLAIRRSPASRKRLDPGLRAAEDQRVDIVRALVGVDCLEVRHHAHDVELVRNAVAAVHIARQAGDLERLATVVALHQRDRRRRRLAGLQQAPEPQRAGEAERDFRLHVGELLLNEL